MSGEEKGVSAEGKAASAESNGPAAENNGPSLAKNLESPVWFATTAYDLFWRLITTPSARVDAPRLLIDRADTPARGEGEKWVSPHFPERLVF